MGPQGDDGMARIGGHGDTWVLSHIH
jgi:hypothetical protein